MLKLIKSGWNKVEQTPRKVKAFALSLGVLAMSGLAKAVTTFAVLPTAAATFYDSMTSLGLDVAVILFGIGGPILIAVVGWNVLRGGTKKGARL